MHQISSKFATRNRKYRESEKREKIMELGNPVVMPKIISLLSSLLQRAAECHDFNGVLERRRISTFHGLTRPPISVQSYLERIFKMSNCSASCLVVAYVYLDRFTQKQPLLPINSFNVHRLIITSVMLAAKFLGDIKYENKHFATIGGISVDEMNILELDFLFGLDFHLNVTPTAFDTYCCFLQREMLLESPPIVVKSLKFQGCFQEDESTSTSQMQRQLAV